MKVPHWAVSHGRRTATKHESDLWRRHVSGRRHPSGPALLAMSSGLPLSCLRQVQAIGQPNPVTFRADSGFSPLGQRAATLISLAMPHQCNIFEQHPHESSVVLGCASAELLVWVHLDIFDARKMASWVSGMGGRGR